MKFQAGDKAFYVNIRHDLVPVTIQRSQKVQGKLCVMTRNGTLRWVYSSRLIRAYYQDVL